MKTTTHTALQMAGLALEHSAPLMAHYPEPVARHKAAQDAVQAELAATAADPWRDFLGTFCALVEDRAAARGWNGRARDKASMEMAAGALATLQCLGDPMAHPFATWGLLALGSRGFAEIQQAAKEWRERGNSLPKVGD